jgi:hypothetical protein
MNLVERVKDDLSEAAYRLPQSIPLRICVGCFRPFWRWRSGYIGGLSCKPCTEKIDEQWEEYKDRMHRLKTMPYSEYLKTEHWKTTRNYKLEDARYRCELCFSRKSLNVHHKTYRFRGCEPPCDLIVLCFLCHAKFHDKLPAVPVTIQ